MDEEREATVASREFGRTIQERLDGRLQMVVPHRHNDRLRRIVERVNADDELYALWTAANVTAIERLGMADHGPVRVTIEMSNSAGVFQLDELFRRKLVGSGLEP